MTASIRSCRCSAIWACLSPMTMQCLKLRYTLSLLALGSRDARNVLGFIIRTQPQFMAGNSLVVCIDLGKHHMLGCTIRILRKKCFKKTLFLMPWSLDLWSAFPNDAIDAKTYAGPTGHCTRTQKKNPLRITEQINHVRLRKSPKSSWKLREYMGKYHLCFSAFAVL